jgi:hypothetical protein
VRPDGTSDDCQVDVNVSHEYSVERWTCLSRDAIALALSIRSDECRVLDLDSVFDDSVPFPSFPTDGDADAERPLPVSAAGNDPRMPLRNAVPRDSKDS